MAAVPSTMLPLGIRAPYFKLPDYNGRNVSLHDFTKKRGLVIVFYCNHCPYVKHIREHFTKSMSLYQKKDIGVVAIQSNDFKKYPDDSPEKMREDALKYHYTFDYLVDEDQRVAQLYKAACTPDFFLFDSNHILIYRGQYDDSRPSNNRTVDGADLLGALDCLLNNQPIHTDQKPSIGCNIKWKPGNEPDYYRV